MNNQDVFPLLRSERKKYRKIIDDQGLIGTVSNITDHTLKQNTSESTMMKTNANNQNEGGSNNNNEKLERNAEGEDEDEGPRSRKNGKKQQRQVVSKKGKRQVYKINIDEVKHRFLSELLYLFYFEIIRKYPDSYKI